MISEAELLQAALRGYQAERDRLDDVIADIKARIANGGGAPLAKGGADHLAKGGGGGDIPTPFKRVMSSAARERIAAAQRKRWAKWHKKK